MEFRFNQTLKMLAVAGVIGSLAACGGGGGGGSPVITPPAEVITAPYKYVFSFVNALDGKPITDALTIQFTGASITSGEVLDSNNKVIKVGDSFTTTNGLFAAAANFNGTEDVFTILGGNLAKGWNTSGVQILGVASKQGEQVVTIKLTRSATPQPSRPTRRWASAWSPAAPPQRLVAHCRPSR